jgi:predicted N-acyltransferase
MNTCHFCGIGFKAYNDFTEHLEASHRHSALKTDPRHVQAQARSTSGRSKQQVVQQAEDTWLRPYIIVSSNETEHLESCRCHVCWMRMADRLIQSQEDSLQ